MNFCKPRDADIILLYHEFPDLAKLLRTYAGMNKLTLFSKIRQAWLDKKLMQESTPTSKSASIVGAQGATPATVPAKEASAPPAPLPGTPRALLQPEGSPPVGSAAYMQQLVSPQSPKM